MQRLNNVVVSPRPGVYPTGARTRNLSEEFVSVNKRYGIKELQLQIYLVPRALAKNISVREVNFIRKKIWAQFSMSLRLLSATY